MSEKDLGQALLRGEEPIDVRVMTDRVLRRDRRRMWVVGAGCVAAWMAVVLLPLATIMPVAAAIVSHESLQTRSAPRGGSEDAPAAHSQALELGHAVRRGMIATFIVSVGSVLLAAVCTVALVVLSRRATLRQVNARLAELSAELRAARVTQRP